MLQLVILKRLVVKMSVAKAVVLGSRSPQRRELLASIVGTDGLQIMPLLSSAEADFYDVDDDAGFEHRLLEIVREKYHDVSRQVLTSRKLTDAGMPPAPIHCRRRYGCHRKR